MILITKESMQAYWFDPRITLSLGCGSRESHKRGPSAPQCVPSTTDCEQHHIFRTLNWIACIGSLYIAIQEYIMLYCYRRIVHRTTASTNKRDLNSDWLIKIIVSIPNYYFTFQIEYVSTQINKDWQDIFSFSACRLILIKNYNLYGKIREMRIKN